jgi:hypothetical protein
VSIRGTVIVTAQAGISLAIQQVEAVRDDYPEHSTAHRTQRLLAQAVIDDLRTAAAQISALQRGERNLEAAERKRQECTGQAAEWCPVHGHCSCPNPLAGLDDPSCGLHSPESTHPEQPEQRAGSDPSSAYRAIKG